ncbi:MAG TPA: peptidoglycan DD-metalloendopeptidase family protein [Candidatus Dormibacteraeota bacterium]|nr:peptidoglycan DD-metalloendopeptidase family protein [Candidatus Dormibacteraeota bacterium]
MRRAAAGLLAAAVVASLVALHTPSARADAPNCSGTSIATDARIACTQAALGALQQRLGGDLAAALTTQQHLSRTVAAATARAQLLSAQLAQEEAKVEQLQSEIAALDDQIASLELRIDNERAQVRALARAMYRRPSSFLDILASSGNLADALTATADLVVAGQRAHALQERLQNDLVKVQADRDARQSDLDQENATLDELQSGADQLTSLQAYIEDLASQLVTLISHIRSEISTLPNVSPDDATAVATLMEQQETALTAQSQTAAWAVAGVGAGQATALIALPDGFGPAGIVMSWPMAGGTLTQPFGPTTFALEPPLGRYAHFHTGIDIAAGPGTPVGAAADGLVVSVQHTSFGYGNYVIVAHGGGLFTLYGHLADTSVVEGQRVLRSQLIGHEGATGLATGPHLHFEVRYNGAVVDPLSYLPPR